MGLKINSGVVAKRSPKSKKISNALKAMATFSDRKRIESDLMLRTRKQQSFGELKSWGNSNVSDVAKNNETDLSGKTFKSLFEVGKRVMKNQKRNENSLKSNKNDLDRDVSCFSSKGFHINMKQYLMKCTLHGLRYIGDGHLSLIERVFWFIAVFLAMVVAAYFISNIYSRWTNEPMIVSLNPENAQLTSIPFPAITICNMNQARKTVANRIMNDKSGTDKKLLQMLCNVENDSAIIDIDSTEKAGEWSYFKHFLINVTQPCTQLITSCYWKSEPRACDTLFNAALTDEGLCCTFNSLHREMMFRNPRDLSDLNVTFPFPAVDWTPEDGYPEDAPPDGFPWRPLGTGANLGLTLNLDAALSEYFCSSTSSVGFKILLHNPSETPKIKDFGDFIQPGYEVRLVVKPRIYDAQTQVRTIAKKKRRCYFSNERKLVYYRTYTQKNCVMECEARLTIERCNCSQYFMPKNSSIRICGLADANCYVELKVAIEDRLGLNESAILLNTNCDDCYPACYELSYGKEFSSAPLTEGSLVREEYSSGKTPEYFKHNMAIVHVYFVDASFVRFTKGELFGFTDFLSNTGGLLGLFLGFSFLSFVEIVYFMSLRLICAYYRHCPKPNNNVYPFSQ